MVFVVSAFVRSRNEILQISTHPRVCRYTQNMHGEGASQFWFHDASVLWSLIFMKFVRSSRVNFTQRHPGAQRSRTITFIISNCRWPSIDVIKWVNLPWRYDIPIWKWFIFPSQYPLIVFKSQSNAILRAQEIVTAQTNSYQSWKGNRLLRLNLLAYRYLR